MTDIHGSKQIYHTCAQVIAIHQPELFNIPLYGPKSYDAKDLVAVHFLKQRHAESGLVRLKKRLDIGTFVQWEDTLKYGT
jgi:hypothetical protein